MKTPKKSSNTSQAKRPAKQKMIENHPTIEDILRNQINLYQYCNDLSNKVRDMELHMQHMDFQSQMMKRDNFEIKSLLNNLGNHLKHMHDREEMSRPSMDEPSPAEGVKPEEKQPVVKKALPLHDDVMTNCEACGRNHHVNLSCCPGCGFKRAKGER